MEDEAQLLVEVWEAMKDFLPSATCNDAAQALVAAFTNRGIELDDLEEAAEECPYLERALDAARGDDEDEGNEEEDSEY